MPRGVFVLLGRDFSATVEMTSIRQGTANNSPRVCLIDKHKSTVLKIRACATLSLSPWGKRHEQ